MAAFRGRQVATMGAAMLGFFVVALDVQIVNVALPTIGTGLGGGLSGLQWLVTGYALTFSALILSAGTLSDRYGARQVYVAGMLLFAAASIACALAPGLDFLIAARLLQGAGAAVVTPTSLAIIREGFADQGQRTRAIGLWAVGGSVAAAAGPILGGALTEIDWRLIFWVNVPVAAVALLCATQVQPSRRRSSSIDLIGQTSAVVGLGAVTYGVIEGGTLGWGSPAILATFAIAGLSAAVFFLAQTRCAHPMVPLHMFRSRQFSVGLAIGFVSMAAFYGVVFVQSLYFQNQRELTPLLTGILFLPMTLAVTLVNLFASALMMRFGNRLLITTGLAVQSLGLLLIAALPPTVSVWTVAATMVLVGVGGAMTVPPIASLVMESAPRDLVGTASGVLNTFRQLGGSLGVAGIGATIAAHRTFMPGLRSSLIATALVLTGTTILSRTPLEHSPRANR